MNREIKRSFNAMDVLPDFDAIRITIATAERIRSWSYGEVKKPETINYRTFKPERDGLFCARIFGPVKDYECLCGKYKRMKYRGVICEKCGVEVTLSKVRRDRMGHIELAAPVAHIWFTKSLPSRAGMLLDIALKDLEKILYFESYVVLDPGMTAMSYGQLLTEEEFMQAQDEYGEEAFNAGIGAEALREMLRKIEPKSESEKLRQDLIECSSEIRRKKIMKRLKLLEAFLESNTPPECLVMEVIPVIPPELRPLVPLDGGRFATSDLNDLYRRVINRNNRLKRLIELRAPEIIIRNEKRMLQESVDALFDNGRRGRAITGTNKRPLKSLADMLKGKQGRFRQNLLGKRVDYSGRSVIVVGPELKLHQCGLPKKMALELFRPFIYARLERYGLASTLKAAKRMVEKERPEVWDVLEDVIREHPVLLNRAPTLHRLGIQAFEPVLIEGKAIQLHPLVCTAFNADFDGDQMAVHIPLSLEAQLEARVLMMSTNNILSPSSGRPIIVPSKDIVLGIYYLSLMADGMPGEGSLISDISEVEHALSQGHLHIHSKVKARVPVYHEDGIVTYQRVDTTPGRLFLGNYLPKHYKMPYELVNQVMTSNEISSLVDDVYRHCGQKETVIFVDRIMTLGFTYMTKSGVSFGKDDLIVPKEKEVLIGQTKSAVAEYEQQYLDGLITQGEKYNKVVDAWGRCTDKVGDAMLQAMSKNLPGEPFNAVYMMIHSKARGSVTQMRQMAGMRGLMTRPSGDIMETPIISNFKEGLHVLEYFISTHGARKGLSDTALKTANSGYLTRRLVDVAQDCIIVADDCGTTQGIHMRSVVEGANTVVPLTDRILGRTASEDIVHPLTNAVIVAAGEMILEDTAELISEASIHEVRIRSVLTCEMETAICAKCYGRDLARGTSVNVGEAVGVIAAQSIGEPGTQLTMRTFHMGGAAQRSAEQSSIESSMPGKVRYKNINAIDNASGQSVVLSRNGEVIVLDDQNRERVHYRIQYGAKLLIKEGAAIKQGQKIAEWDAYTIPVITEKEGVAHFVDLIDSVTMREVIDESTGISSRAVIDAKSSRTSAELRPMISMRDAKGNPIKLSNGLEARYFLPIDAIISVENGVNIPAGEVIARIPRETSKTRDITGGLPRVSELFEARQPKDAAIIAEFDGKIEFGKDYKAKRRIIVTPENDALQPVEYLVPRGRHIVIQEGDYVRKGDLVVEGNPVPHDILRVMGVEALAVYLVSEIQQVYRLQGIAINDKHIEVIVRQMLQKTEVYDAGDTNFIVGDHVDRVIYDHTNNALIKEGKRPASGQPILQGITKASLHTKSFISAASFQETTRVLTEAAVSGKLDVLAGLKENVIVGRLIPAGTGSAMRRMKATAQDRDKDLLIQAAPKDKDAKQSVA